MDIVMDAGSTFRMVMVDQNRRPVSGVKVSLDRWQGSRAISWRTQTDGQGRFSWDHAPAGQVMFRFEKPGYSTYLHSVSLPVSSEVTYTYNRQARIAGRVIDVETRKPIDQFRAMIRYRYQNGSGSSSTSGRKGSFSMTIGTSSYTELNLVIESRGYEPLSAELPVTGSSSNLFELKKAIPIVGVVLGPDGAPVAKAEVVLINPSTGAYMYEPGKFRRTSESYEVVITDADGRFELTPKLEADLVLAAHPKLGFVQAPVSEMLRTGKIMLQPWGHVRGVLRVGDKVEPFHEIALQTLYAREPGEQRSSRPVYLYYYLKPEPDGRFAFDQVPPGNRVAYLRYQFQEKQSGTLKLSHSVPLSVKPGETNDIVIGGTGRTVLGKVEVTNANGLPVDWRRDNHTLRLRPTSSVTMPSVSFPPNATPQERQRIINQRNEAYRTALEDQTRRLESVERLYVLLFDNDGSFQVPNVPPGDYTLSLHLTDPRQPNSYRTIGMLNRQITIPEGATPHKIETVQLRLNP
jgi:hypothetical protein